MTASLKLSFRPSPALASVNCISSAARSHRYGNIICCSTRSLGISATIRGGGGIAAFTFFGYITSHRLLSNGDGWMATTSTAVFTDIASNAARVRSSMVSIPNTKRCEGNAAPSTPESKECLTPIWLLNNDHTSNCQWSAGESSSPDASRSRFVSHWCIIRGRRLTYRSKS